MQQENGNQTPFLKHLAINTNHSPPIPLFRDVTQATIHASCPPNFFLVPSSAKVNSSVNRANIPRSTLRRGQKKKHKSLLASVVSTAAAAWVNFHTLNIYFHSLCVCRFSVVVYSPQSLLSASYFLLLQKIKDLVACVL